MFMLVIVACRRDLEHAGKEESLILEGDIGGGLVLRRQISLSNDNPKILQVDSGIIARSVGAGSGGFSRLDPKPFLIHDNCNFFQLPSRGSMLLRAFIAPAHIDIVNPSHGDIVSVFPSQLPSIIFVVPNKLMRK